MKNIKKISCLLLILVISITCIFAGCGEKAEDVTEENKTIEVKDSKGESVTVPLEPKRVVVTNNNVAEVIYVLGEADKIVGVSDTTKFPEELANKEKVGKSFTPDIEKILELKPDIVFGYGDYVKKESIEKLNAAGVPFISIDAFKIETLEDDIKTLGTIFNKKERADEYVSFINKYLDLVNEKVEKIDPDKKTTVFWEGYSEGKSVSKGAGGHEMITLSGGNNIAGNEPVEYPKVSNEWVIEQNPQMVIKVAPTKVPFGYGISDCKDMNVELDKLIKRTGWENIDAIKNENVHIISNEIATSARSVVGICYLAKWAYPEEFKDLDPEAVHKELIEKFYNIDYKGTWVCP